MKKFILSVGAAAMLASTSITGFTPGAYAQQAGSSIYLPMVQSGQQAQAPSHQHAPDRNKPTNGAFAIPS